MQLEPDYSVVYIATTATMLYFEFTVKLSMTQQLHDLFLTLNSKGGYYLSMPEHEAGNPS